MKYVQYEVNAFTAGSRNGQAAGVVLNADGLNGVQMLKIARTAGFTETAFVSASDDGVEADFRLRFFTVAGEIDLCGHATIASWYLMHQRGLISGNYVQQTKAGNLGVRISDDGLANGSLVCMEQAKATFYEKFGTNLQLLSMLGIDANDLSPKLVPQIVSTGIRDLFVALKHQSAVSRLRPKLAEIIAFSDRYDTSSVHVFSLYSKDNPAIASARNFAPIDGIDEEAATGTSNGGLLCYLKQYGALEPMTEYLIEQGEAMGRLSHIFGRFADDGTVWIGGKATVVGKRIIDVV